MNEYSGSWWRSRAMNEASGEASFEAHTGATITTWS
jgi:hypothetical protein